MLGQSIALDFLLHAGLGVAAASMGLVALLKPPFFESLALPTWMKHVLNTVTGLALIASQIAIAAFMGATKGMRVSDNIVLGYAFGIVVTLAVAWAVRPKKREPEND